MIRDEAAGDAPAVRVVNEEAFGSPLEAGIVDALRAACTDRVSLVPAAHVVWGGPAHVGNTYREAGLSFRGVVSF